MLYRVDGIVIKSMDYGEGNKIITLYTKQLGKVGVLVRGALKAKSRHAALAQPFTYGEYVYFKSGQLGTLNHAELVSSRQRLREDLLLSAYAAYFAELIDRLCDDQDVNLYIFEQLNAAYDHLEDGKDPQIVMYMMELKMLSLAGYEPELDVCVHCGQQEELTSFSVRLGGALCKRCHNQDQQAIQLPERMRKLLSILIQTHVTQIGKTDLKPETKQWLKQTISNWFNQHLDVRLKSKSLLDQLERSGF